MVLTVWSLSKPRSRPDYSRDAPALFAQEREREPTMVKDGPEAVRRGPRGRTGRSQRWVRYEHRFVRNRALGEMQRRVLGVLQQSTEPGEDGPPVTLVKEIVGIDRSNARRAIRTLLMRGLIEESEDGRRIRLTFLGAFARALST
jgi:hypothetical protein